MCNMHGPSQGICTQRKLAKRDVWRCRTRHRVGFDRAHAITLPDFSDNADTYVHIHTHIVYKLIETIVMKFE